MCRSRLWLLYWVSTQILRMPPLARLDSAKSISRYRPPNGTAGLARSAVSGDRRVPAPQASTIPRTDGCAMSGPPIDAFLRLRAAANCHAAAYPAVQGRGRRTAAPDLHLPFLAARGALPLLVTGRWPATPHGPGPGGRQPSGWPAGPRRILRTGHRLGCPATRRPAPRSARAAG